MVIENQKNIIEKQEPVLKIVGVTACSAGIAHTYMAQEQLQKFGKKMDYQIKIETQGTIGVENRLSDEEIKNADLVIIASDIKIDLTRFVGKKLYQTKVKDAVSDPEGLINLAISEGKVFSLKGTKVGAIRIGTNKKSGILNHLMSGISWMIPMTIAGGILMAFGNIYAQVNNDWSFNHYGTSTEAFCKFLYSLGTNVGFVLMIPVFAGFVAYSIADRPGVAPAMMIAFMFNDANLMNFTVIDPNTQAITPVSGAGFIGSLIVGLLMGYFVLLLKKIKWPKIIQPVVPLMIIPILAVLVVGSFVRFVIGGPVITVIHDMYVGLNNFSNTTHGAGSLAVGLVIALMIGFDLGGPINKTALLVGTAVFTDTLNQATLLHPNTDITQYLNFIPGTAAQAAISVPPLGAFIATMIFKKRFSKAERVAGKGALATGLFGITEGAIPFAAADPIRAIFANLLGSAFAGLVVTAFNVHFWGGLGSPVGTFLGIIDSKWEPFPWLLATIGGAFITGITLGLVKRKIKGNELDWYLEEKAENLAKRKECHLKWKNFFSEPKKIPTKIGTAFVNFFIKLYLWIIKQIKFISLEIWKALINIGTWFKIKTINFKNIWVTFFKKIIKRK